MTAKALMSIAVATISLSLSAASAGAQTTTRVSLSPEGWQAPDQSSAGAVEMTPDGRFIIFLAGDSRGPIAQGLHIWDRQTGTTSLLRAVTKTLNTNYDTERKPAISDDGRFIAFVDGPIGGPLNVSVLDRNTMQVTPVSAAYDTSGGRRADISGDGRFVAFENIVFGGGVRVWDVTAAAPRLFGTQTTLPGEHARLSADGRYVAYNGGRTGSQSFIHGDAYRYDFLTGLNQQVNTTALGISAATPDAHVFDISADGRYVIFRSGSGDLVAGDDADSLDVFLKDMLTGAIDRVNVNGNGARVAVDFTTVPSMSPDARWFVFTSMASNAVANDTNGLIDVFLYDRTSGTVERVNLPLTGPEAYAGNSYTGIPSGDGRYVAFVSDAHNLVPGDTSLWPDVFVRDRQGVPPCSVTLSLSGVSTVSSTSGSGSVTVAAPAGCLWTAVSNANWLHLTGATSGTGNGTISYTYDAYSGSQTFARAGGIVVNDQALSLRQPGTSPRSAFGVWDAPSGPNDTVNNVTGSIAFGGWAQDYEGIARVRIMRDPVAGEGSAQIYVGDGVRVEGARPDVAAAGYWYPYNHSAGWGYLLLTNALPNQGNGTFRFYVYLDDDVFGPALLGTRTLNCTNATAAGPFGTIDTPGQGETVSGTIVNFGWALTPQPNSIPTDGSTISVFIDGVNVGRPVYNNFRSDIASYFPNYANSNGAVGHFTFDTRAYADGLHTISWVVTDNSGASAGIGSRYFTIINSGTVPAGPLFARRDDSPAAMAAGAVRVVIGSRQRLVWPDADGRITLHAARDQRLEIQLNPWGEARTGCDRYELSTGGTDAAPVGSTLDAAKGVFSWLAGPAFAGAHDVVFTRRRCGLVEERVTVRVVFTP